MKIKEKKISHGLVCKSLILIFSPKEGLKMSVHTDFQQNELANKARRRVFNIEKKTIRDFFFDAGI